MLAKLCMVVSCTGVKAAVTAWYFLEITQAAIQLTPSIHAIVFIHQQKSSGKCPQISFYSRERYHTEMAAQPGSAVYETLFDSFNLISSVSSRNLWTRNQRKFDFRSTWTQYIWTKNISLTQQMPQGTIILLLPARRSVEQRGSPQGVCLLGTPAVHVPSKQPRAEELPAPPSQLFHGNTGISKSPVPGSGFRISGYYSRGWSRAWSGSAHSIH